jgi:hypothetical protein
MQRATPRKIAKRSPRVNAEQLQERINRMTGKAVARGIKALSLYHGKPGERWLYSEFRDQKRKIYSLYPDQPDKAKAIVKFILVRSGWATRSPG